MSGRSLANDAYYASLRYVMDNGDIVSPRGIETKEVLNDRMVFDMNYPVINNEARKLSYRFLAAEAYWITSGLCLVEEIEPYNLHIAQFSDDGYIFNGAYGPMYQNQFEFVVNALKNDLTTRQAWMTIWHPNPVETKDHKCTIAMGFNVRRGRIHTTVQMRSNDLFLGRPYDVFNFTMMTLKILCALNQRTGLGIRLGTMTLNSASAHIYEDKYEKVNRVLNSVWHNTNPVPEHFNRSWPNVISALLATRNGDYDRSPWRIKI